MSKDPNSINFQPLDDGDAEARGAARKHINDLALEADSDGSEFADRQAAKAAIKRAVK